jgi:hypothetical protein
MAETSRFRLPSALLAATLIAAAQAAAGAQAPCPASATQPVPGSRLAGDWQSSPAATLRPGNPIAPPAGLDLGIAPANTRLDRMLLLLQPSPARQQALDAFLSAQQTPGNCAYHQWLTPAQFADQFANSAADVAAISAWLAQKGFSVAPLPAGRRWIEFSGTANQVEQTFGAAVHGYFTTAGTRYALTSGISVPAVFVPLIRGLVSLDGALSVPALTAPQAVVTAPSVLAGESSPIHAEALTPQLLAPLLHLDAVHASGATGAGESIAIASRSNVQAADIAVFRSTFGLPASAVSLSIDGPDPGFTADQAEAELAASWAGAAAPGANIVVVSAASTSATDGIDLSLAAIVDQNLAHTMLVDFSSCEAALSDAHQAFYAAVYRQASAEGVAVIAASGDSGAAACHAPGSTTPVSSGYAVNGLASTPWNTAVGAAAFASSDGSSLAAWSPINPLDPAYAGGGGRSTAFAVPSWQAAIQPTSSGRMLPDLALPTGVDSAFSRGLAFCFSGSATPAGCTLVRSGGTSAAAAIFGGIAAVIAQQKGAQGNLAPALFAMRARSGVFNDVQQGAATLTCAAGSPDCDASGKIGFAAANGYDLATGLGSPNVQSLLNAFANPDGTTTDSVTLAVSPAQNSYNPSASITFTATVSSTTGTPTGTVNFTNQNNGQNLNSAPYPLTSGQASITVAGALPIGGNSIIAAYSGDATFAATNSAPITVNIATSSTTVTITPSTATPTVGTPLAVTATVNVGTPPAGTASPAGTMTLTFNGASNGVNPPSTAVATSKGVTSATFTVTPTLAIASLQASYTSSDTNYSSSVATTPINSAKGNTITTLAANPSPLTTGAPETFTATIAPAASVSGVTYTFAGDTVTFYDGGVSGVSLGTANVTGNTAVLSNITLTGTGSHAITAIFNGDGNWNPSPPSNAITNVAALIPVTVTLASSPAVPAPGQAVTLTATVTPNSAPPSTAEQNPTGNIIFYNGTTVLGTVAVAAAQGDTATASLSITSLAAGQDSLTAVYVGDQVFATATSNAITINLQGFTITPGSGNPAGDLDIDQGSSAKVSFVITALGGFSGQVSIVCNVPSQDDIACTPSPQTVTPTNTVTFTIQTFTAGNMPSTGARRNPRPLWQPAAGGTALAVLLFFLLPAGKRARLFRERTRRMLILLLLLVGFCGAGIGCSAISPTVSNQVNGTPLGETTITITAAASVDNAVVSQNAYVLVNVLPVGSTGTAQPAPSPK